MNIYKNLNEMIGYIEAHLEDSISYTTLSHMLGVNEYTMHNLFRIIANISLSEYIRKRRLSNAGFDLYHTQAKVIDVALKYQYDNATSFSRAFEKFHGIKPSYVKNHPEKLKLYARITFKEDIVHHQNMEYSILKKEEMILYGKGISTTTQTISQDAPKHFQFMLQTYSSLYGHIPYGMTVYQDRFEDEHFEYWTLYDKPIPGFKQWIIPSSKWLSFSIPSQDSDEIQNVIHQFYVDFVASSPYTIRELPELEYYHDDITEFLVPIED